MADKTLKSITFPGLTDKYVIPDQSAAISQLNADLTELEKATLISDTASGAIATFPDGAEGNASAVVVSIEPVQSGSGDPSPDNVRPITGHTSCTVTRNDGTAGSNETTVTTQLGQTVYGGTLNVTTGVLTVDRLFRELSSNMSWTKSSSYAGGFFASKVNFAVDGHEIKESTPFMCSHAKSVAALSQYVFGTCYMDGSVNIRIMEADTTVAQWGEYLDAQITAETPVSCCFELAEPFTVQLTAEEVTTLKGQNDIFADTGDVTVQYPADTKLYIDKKIAEALA